MYDYDYDEDTAGYDYIDDGGESEARKKWARYELEEFSQWDKETFIESVKNHNQKYGIRKLPPEPKSEPKDFADGLKEWIESKAGRPIPEHCDENNEDDDVDGKNLYDEVQAEAEKILEEELNNPAYWEKVLREANERSSQTAMYDFGLGQMSNEQAMSDYYGLNIVNRIREEIRESCNLPDDVRETGQISEKLWQELRDIRAGKIPHPKSASKKKSNGKHSPDLKNSGKKTSESSAKSDNKKSKRIEIIQRERQPGDDYFMTTERGIIRNKSYRELFKGRGTVYEWIWANLVRDKWVDTKGYPIREKYYDRGLLAYCSTHGKIGRDCGLAKNTVIKYLHELKEAGIIKIEHLVPKDGKRGQSVFILGEWKKVNGKRVERFYRDEIFISKKIVKN